MRPNSFVFLLAALCLSATPVAVSASGGCATRPGPIPEDMPEVLVVIDGEVSDKTMDEIDRAIIGHVEIICWKAAEQLFGVKVSNGVIAITTQPNPFDRVKEGLAELAVAQREYRDTNDRYAAELEQLPFVDLGSNITAVLTVTADGWFVRAKHAWLNHDCVVFSGTPPEMRERGSVVPPTTLEENVPVCFSQHDHVSG